MSGLFPNAWRVAAREYTTRVRSRTFVIVTFLLAVVAFGLAMLPVGVRLIGGEEQPTIGLDAPDGVVAVAQLQAILTAGAQGAQDAQNGYRVVAVQDARAGQAQVREGKLDGLLTVVRASSGDLAFTYLTDAGPLSQTVLAVRSAATQMVIADRLQRAGIDPAQAGQIFAPTAFDLSPADPNATSTAGLEGPSGMLAYILVILTFMAVVTYGSWVATSVAEEKSSRVMELLITAATPRQLLAGKVLGTGAAGLTQYAVMLAAVVVGLILQGVLSNRLFGDTGTDPLAGADVTVLVPFTLLFVPGFLLYCVLYAAFGSMASRQEDVTQVTGPMLVIGMGGYFASFVAIATPDVAWVRIMSLIPFFSPYLLPARYVLAANVAPWEWAVAGVLMLAFLLGALWVAARIYSAGVLLYGQQTSLRRVWRAVRVAR